MMMKICALLLFICTILITIVICVIVRVRVIRQLYDYTSTYDGTIVIAACGDDINVQQIKKMGTRARIWVYNKCDNLKDKTAINLPNVGRDFHTFLYHIVTQYEYLPEGRIIFTASTLNKHNRLKRLQHLMNFDGDCFCDWGHGTQSIRSIWNDWTKNSYDGTQLLPAVPRGFRSWCRTHLGDIDTSSKRCGNGTFLTTGARIRNRPLAFYVSLLNQLRTHNAPEAVHYMERVTAHIFM